ncbi:MAG: hypothetical protein UV58_C0014G0037 [Candidatus Wolfebacteria bacterium GW2011_GWC1_43_10]|uniref:ATP-cone domain-containing protein n=1 Tax=Candidatus Wolfebacteria bacterium GW2011_GWC1_43_10 TaxID=1619011 RepID=A0A0G1EG34_9BACT|nr:MAG: hypothetical protein UV58_C0014G0037 [Candidatus Wolfebacteria bacterium GW2011_GWC1_43_10]KKT22021.1 MAG: hypothetical protein UW08_C0020G0007 [Parcubacteria group bacterium GW2011_GWB1_43_8b]
MAKWVIKRGGKKEPFSAAKIKKSIRDVAKDAHLSRVRVKRAVSKVSRAALKLAAKRKIIATATLKKTILSQLTKVEPTAAKAWRKYDQRRRARRRRRR